MKDYIKYMVNGFIDVFPIIIGVIITIIIALIFPIILVYATGDVNFTWLFLVTYPIVLGTWFYFDDRRY